MPALQVFQQRELAQKIATLLDAALMQYTELQQQAAGMDVMELEAARHAIRPGKERETAQRLQAAHGKKFDSAMLTQSRKDVAKMLDEKAESVSIRQTIQQLQGQQGRQRHEKEHSQER